MQTTTETTHDYWQDYEEALRRLNESDDLSPEEASDLMAQATWARAKARRQGDR